MVGAENIPREPCIILAKHESAWETLAFQAIFPPQVWVVKRELLWIPFFGWGLAMLSPIAIDRKAGPRALRQMVEQGRERLQRGFCIVIFPEGTRAAPGVRGVYQAGGAWLALKTGAPVLPVAHNAGTYWPRNAFVKRPGTITVSIGPLVRAEGTKRGRAHAEYRAVDRERNAADTRTMRRARPGQLDLPLAFRQQQAVGRAYLALEGTLVTYTIKRSARRRAISILVDEEGVRVGAPWDATHNAIERLLRKHSAWVLRKLEEWQVRRAPPRRWADGEPLMLLGTPVHAEARCRTPRAVHVRGSELVRGHADARALGRPPGARLAARARRSRASRSASRTTARLLGIERGAAGAALERAHALGKLPRERPHPSELAAGADAGAPARLRRRARSRAPHRDEPFAALLAHRRRSSSPTTPRAARSCATKAIATCWCSIGHAVQLPSRSSSTVRALCSCCSSPRTSRAAVTRRRCTCRSRKPKAQTRAAVVTARARARAARCPSEAAPAPK